MHYIQLLICRFKYMNTVLYNINLILCVFLHFVECICLQHYKSVTHTALFCTMQCLSPCIILTVYCCWLIKYIHVCLHRPPWVSLHIVLYQYYAFFSVQYEYTCRVMLFDLQSYVSICLQTSISVIPLTARPSFWRHLHEASEIQTVCCK